MVQLRIVSGSGSHDKIRLFVTNVKSNSSSIENVEGVLGIELGWQLLGIELGMYGQLLGGIELGRCGSCWALRCVCGGSCWALNSGCVCEQLLGIELGVGSCHC